MQQNTLGNIAYEITNYPPEDGRSLGNVNVVISDRKTYVSTSAAFYPEWSFSGTEGEISNRTTNSDNYRFGYNGMSNHTWFSGTESLSGVNPEWSFSGTSGEKDNETKGSGNSYTTLYRQLDTRVGRWSSIDPVFQPRQSPYCSMDGNPALYNDIKGDKPKEAALIAKHVYGGMKDSKLKGGWKPSSITLEGTDFKDGDETGLKGRLYERTKKGVTEYVYAYAGNEDLLVDGVTDLTQIAGFSKQYDKAYGITKNLSEAPESKELTFVVHNN